MLVKKDVAAFVMLWMVGCPGGMDFGRRFSTFAIFGGVQPLYE
jgi:hypothetical protein